MSFRENYLTYDEITRTLQDWAKKHPGHVRLQSIGKSTGGRDLWVLVIGPEPDRARPAVWVGGNMHASELAGSSVALAMAEDVIALHTGSQTVRDLPAHVCERLREVLFYVMPRISPDGAESILRTGGYVRSNDRDRRHHAPTPRWICKDVDGNGVSLVMRVADPAGEFALSKEAPGVLVPRTLEDVGPFYKVYPEGIIEHFDGHTIPDPYFLSDNDTDMNRNFPYAWAPEPEQIGAGSFPTSEPESRAVVEFTSARPHIVAWLDLHTFGGVQIRPLGNAPDSKMEPFDLAVYRQIEAWGEQYGGYPTVSGYHEFLYEPDKPLRGDVIDYAYHQRGALGYTVEIWDLFRELGIPRRKPFVDHYAFLTRDDLVRFAKWDAEKNKGRVFRPWKKVTHPQLGEVEVGGLDMRVGLSNPPYERLGEVCEKQAKTFLRVAAMAPAIRVHHTHTEALGDGVTRVRLVVENEGYLPSYVLASAKKLALDARVFVHVAAEGCEVVGDARVELGHLEGWGRGLFDSGASIFHMRSKGNGASRVASFVVKGRGVLHVTASGLRVGAARLDIEI